MAVVLMTVLLSVHFFLYVVLLHNNLKIYATFSMSSRTTHEGNLQCLK